MSRYFIWLVAGFLSLVGCSPSKPTLHLYTWANYFKPELLSQFELETGFWWGTGYISYGLSVGVSVISFLLWLLIIGMSVQDNRPFYWLAFNGVLFVVMVPYLMRLSRSLWLAIFVGYERNAPNP